MSDGVFDLRILIFVDDSFRYNVNVFFIFNFIFRGIFGREFNMIGGFFYMNGNGSRISSFEYVENYEVNKCI